MNEQNGIIQMLGEMAGMLVVLGLICLVTVACEWAGERFFKNKKRPPKTK